MTVVVLLLFTVVQTQQCLIIIQLANVDNGSCIEFVYGCMDSTQFNYNPLANATNNSIPCIPFIYGCTDPSAFNYDPTANTEDFSCIAFVYGCMDSLALNYDPLANTDNGSCIEVVVGCMDSEAYNYEPTANVSDTVFCRIQLLIVLLVDR